MTNIKISVDTLFNFAIGLLVVYLWSKGEIAIVMGYITFVLLSYFDRIINEIRSQK